MIHLTLEIGVSYQSSFARMIEAAPIPLMYSQRVFRAVSSVSQNMLLWGPLTARLPEPRFPRFIFVGW